MNLPNPAAFMSLINSTDYANISIGYKEVKSIWVQTTKKVIDDGFEALKKNEISLENFLSGLKAVSPLYDAKDHYFALFSKTLIKLDDIQKYVQRRMTGLTSFTETNPAGIDIIKHCVAKNPLNIQEIFYNGVKN